MYQNTAAPSELRFVMRKYLALLIPITQALEVDHWDAYLRVTGRRVLRHRTSHGVLQG